MNKEHLKWGFYFRLCLGLLCFPLSLYGLEHPLLTITSDEDKRVFKFVIETDKDNEFITHIYKDSTENDNSKKKRQVLSVTKFVETGLVLEKRDDHIVIQLSSENFASHNGGHITLDTLFNGATGTRKEYEFELTRTSESWEVIYEGRPIEHIHLISRKVFPLGTVGIENIEVR